VYRTIWKFPVRLAPQQAILMPAGADLLDLQFQGNQGLVLWARVNPGARMVSRCIVCHGTGNGVSQGEYIASVQMNGGSFVWHFFDEGES
jgi:hypothetical protein